MSISWQDFEKIDMRVGTVIDAQRFPEARRPAYILNIDFGEKIGVKKSSAQITTHYQPEELVDKQVIAVVNFPPKQIGPIRSECLVMGVYDQDDSVVLLQPEKTIPNGSKIG
ncbi:MAG: tRNA-binding protein [Bacteroidota bacterium]